MSSDNTYTSTVYSAGYSFGNGSVQLDFNAVDGWTQDSATAAATALYLALSGHAPSGCVVRMNFSSAANTQTDKGFDVDTTTGAITFTAPAAS